MFKIPFLYLGLVTATGALPLGAIKGIEEGFRFGDVDNYIPRYDEITNYQFPINSFEDEDLFLESKPRNGTTKTTKINKKLQPEPTITNTSITKNVTPPGNSAVTFTLNITVPMNSSFDEIELSDYNLNGNSSDKETERLPRQELNDTKNDPEFESQEEGSSEEEGNMLTGLISAFLGGLSRPDGSIDVEAIVGLLGSLSTQNDDGSYDFQGLTDLLRGFFGGGGDDGGGSDVGSFAGGLIGAIIKGVANPPGAKGAGVFTGKVVSGILPALSAPAPPDEMDMGNKPQGSDSGGFLSGLIKTVLSSSSGSPQGGGSDSNIFKIIFQLITSVLSGSSSSKSQW